MWNTHRVPYCLCVDAAACRSGWDCALMPRTSSPFTMPACCTVFPGCVSRSHLAGLTVVGPSFLPTTKNSLSGSYRLPSAIHIRTQKENFNKTSKGPAAIFRGKVSYKGSARKLPRESCWKHPWWGGPVSSRFIVYLSLRPSPDSDRLLFPPVATAA